MTAAHFRPNVAQRGDALALLRSLPNACTPLTFFDPQHETMYDSVNAGSPARPRWRAPSLPNFRWSRTPRVCREIARVLKPGGYLVRWVDTFCLVEAHHQRVRDALKGVDLIAWDSGLHKENGGRQ